MGFGGAAAAMAASLKNNNRRNKREAFSHLIGESDSESQGINIEPVSEDALQEIRDKLRRQRSIVFRKRLMACILTIILIMGILIYASL